MSGHEVYVDPWQEYKAISAKLKKRFLRRPNVTEATREFRQLANRLKEEECLHYAGLCHLAIARCEHSSNNVGGESSGLKDAARLFMEAEKERVQLGLPGLKQNLTAAIHCYGHAIKTHVEHKQVCMAACLSLELGSHLYNLERPFEAIEHFERAVRYFDADPLNKISALDWLALCQSDMGKFTECLNTVDALWTLAGRVGGCVGAEVGRNCEIATLFLLLELRALPSQMNQRQSSLMQLYTWVPDPQRNDPSPPPGCEVREEEDFLLLQSFVTAVEWKEAGDADICLTQLAPKFKSAHLLSLGMDLVAKLYQGDYPTD